MKSCLFCASRCVNMLCLWIFLFSVTSGTIAQFQNEDDYRCLIPASDVVRNGKFFVDSWMGSTWMEKVQPPAGTKLLTYELEFQCDPGFFLLGNPYVRCVPAQMEEFPKCSDVCEPSNPDCSVQTIQSDRISTNLDGGTDSEQCGIVSNAPTALAGGRAAVPGDVPWQAAIYDKSSNPFMQICGGSIVSKDVIISAAHCFKLPDEFYAVAVGKIYRPYNNPLDGGVQKSEVLEVRIPPRYRGSVTSFQDDIAAVILATPIRFTSMILPVCLHFGADFDEVQLAPGMLGRVAGWGIDSKDGRPSQVLNLAEMPMVDVGACFMLQDMSFIQYITSDKICAGYTNGTSLCKGDSGGGLAVPHRSGYTTRYYLRGIVSTGPPPTTINECNINAVTTFTRVAKHEYFVKSAIAKKPLQEDERRTPSIIPANFIKSNQNILINNGANEGLPLKLDSVIKIDTFTNQRSMYGDSRDPQEPGNFMIVPDKLNTDGDRNPQDPVKENLVQTSHYTDQRPVIGSFVNSHDPQAHTPSTVVVIPETLTTDEDPNTQVPVREDLVQTSNYTDQRPVIGSSSNSHDPQAQAPGTVVVIPDILTTEGNKDIQDPPRSDPDQETGIFTNKGQVFSKTRDPQALAHGTVVVLPDIDRDNEDPLREDAVQPVRIFDKEQTDAPNVSSTTGTGLTDIGIKNGERPLEDSFIPKPVDGLDDNDRVSTDLNRDNTPNVPTVITEDFLTTLNPHLQYSAPNYSNYPHWPNLPHMPYQYKPNQNWYYPSQNGHYPSQNGHYPSQNVPYPSENEQNVDHNGYFGQDWHQNNPDRNSYNHNGFYQGHWWRK